MAVQPKLILLNTELQNTEFALSKDVTTIGRAPDNDVVLDLISVSRNHARIERFGTHYMVSDLGSRNGIKIDGKAAPEGPLREGGTLAVGDALFRVVGVGPAPGEAHPPLAPRAPGFRKDRAPTPPPSGPPAVLGPAAPVAMPFGPQAAPAAPAQPAAPRRARPAAVVALVVILCLGALWGVYKFYGRVRDPFVLRMLPVVIKVNESRWLPVRGVVTVGGTPQEIRGADFDEHTIAIDNPDVVSAGKFGDGEMVVKGLSYGNAKIIMRSLGGNLIELDVFVRGRMDDREEMISQARISDAERKRLAEMAHQAGNIHMGKGRPFLALQEYQAGVSYLKHVADKGALYVTLRDEARKAEKTVQDRYTQYAQQARQAHSVGDYTKALDLINLIIDLIPDQNDPRHQRARDFLQRWELEKAPKKK